MAACLYAVRFDGYAAVALAPVSDDGYNVSLEIQNIVVSGAVIFQRIGLSGVVIDEIHDVVAPGLAYHLTVLSQVVVGYAVYGLAVPNSGKVISVADKVASLVCLCQLPPVRPTQFPVAGAVMPDSGVANGVVGNGFAIISGQKIQPFAVTVGIGVRFCTADTADIAIGVVGVVIDSVGVDFLGQLILRIVGIAGVPGGVGGVGYLGDVAACVILIAELKVRKAGAALTF